MDTCIPAPRRLRDIRVRHRVGRLIGLSHSFGSSATNIPREEPANGRATGLGLAIRIRVAGRRATAVWAYFEECGLVLVDPWSA